MTPFRKTQAKLLLEAQLQALAPNMVNPESLHEVVEEVLHDRELWRHLGVLSTERPTTRAPEDAC